MARTIDVPSRSPKPRKRLIRLFSAILALVGSVLVYDSWPAPRNLRIHERASGSPYKNTRPGVKYVGDAVFIGCHSEIAQTYRNHPMGRSLSPIESASPNRGPRSRRRACLRRPRASNTPSKIGTGTSSTKRRDGMNQAASSPRPKVKSGSWSAQGEWRSPTWSSATDSSSSRRSPGMRGIGDGTCRRATRSQTVTSTCRSSPCACTAMRTVPSRWREPSTVTVRPSSRAMRLAASDATDRANCTPRIRKWLTAGT